MEQISHLIAKFDLQHAQTDIDSGVVEFCKYYAPNENTVYVGKLPRPYHHGGRQYQTGLVGINGKVIYCEASTCQIMRRFSRTALYSYELSECVGEHLGLTNYPYFCGVQSFVTEVSPRRGTPTSWICSQWYRGYKVSHGATWITFVHQEQRVQVCTAIKPAALIRQLGLVRFAVEQSQVILYQKLSLLDSTVVYRVHKQNNLPELLSLEQPTVPTIQQIRDWQIESRCRRILHDIASAEGINEKSLLRHVKKQLDPDFRKR